jgi:D-amino-acid oxidase
MTDVAVIGAGIAGLTCAVRLQEAGAQVTLVMADEPARTVSAVAAAVWYPSHTVIDSRVVVWARRTFDELAGQAAHSAPGVVMRPTRMLLRGPSSTEPWWSAGVSDFRTAQPAAPFTGEWQFTVPSVEMKPYLDWLTQRIASAGGRLLPRRVERLADAAALAAVVVNATGLAAGALAADPDVYPARGQIVLVTNPGLRTSVRDEENPAGLTYIHPRSRDVVLGGTFERGATDCTPSPSIGREIIARCSVLVPELRDARILDQLVGLRPAREGGVRLARDPVDLPGGVPLIHDYGHGGAGVTLAWGCADEVVRLVRGALPP